MLATCCYVGHRFPPDLARHPRQIPQLKQLLSSYQRVSRFGGFRVICSEILSCFSMGIPWQKPRARSIPDPQKIKHRLSASSNEMHTCGGVIAPAADSGRPLPDAPSGLRTHLDGTQYCQNVTKLPKLVKMAKTDQEGPN